MKQRRKSLIDPSLLGDNPLMEDAPIIRSYTFTKNKKMYITDDSGALVDSYIVPTSYSVESIPYTRIYHHPLYMDTILSLSHPAMKLYTYLTYAIEANKDYIWINKPLFKKRARVSQAKYVLAIEELELAGIIYSTDYTDTYFINPYIFYCGNRIRKFPDMFKDSNEE